MERRRSLMQQQSEPVDENINIWDEEWEQGQYNTVGTKVSSTSQIRCKNLIRVKPNTEYYLHIGVNVACRVYFCTENDTVISYTAYRNATFTTPANCKFIKFHTGSGYGIVYNNNISINYPSTDHDYHEHI